MSVPEIDFTDHWHHHYQDRHYKKNKLDHAKIIAFYQDGYTQRDLATYFKVSVNLINEILNDARKDHQIDSSYFKCGPKLKPLPLLSIADEYQKGASFAALARKYHVSPQLISQRLHHLDQYLSKEDAKPD